MTRLLVVEDSTPKFAVLKSAIAAVPAELAPEVVRVETVFELTGGIDAAGTTVGGISTTKLAEFDLVLVDFGLQTLRYGGSGPLVELLLPPAEWGEHPDGPVELTPHPIELTTGIGVLLYLTQVAADPAFRRARGERDTPVFWLYGAQDEAPARLAVAAAQAWFGCPWFPLRETAKMADQMASILDGVTGSGGYKRIYPADRLLQSGPAAGAALDLLTECLWPQRSRLDWPSTFDAYTWLRELHERDCAFDPTLYWTAKPRHGEVEHAHAGGLVRWGKKPNQVSQFYDEVVDRLYVGLRNLHAAFGRHHVSDWPADRATFDAAASASQHGRKVSIKTAPVYGTLESSLTESEEFWTAEDVAAALLWHRAMAATDAAAAESWEDVSDAATAQRHAEVQTETNRWRRRLSRSARPK